MSRDFDTTSNGATSSEPGLSILNQQGGWVQTVSGCWKRAVQIARASIGVPDYDTYVAHFREHHPERQPMSYSEFFTQRQNARYKGGGGRCC
jgi:uncharacterized short protein YbdD (DUF466 family)